MSPHTPGPWIWEGDEPAQWRPDLVGTIRGSNGEVVCSQVSLDPADIRLIAKAPEMYETLCTLERWCNPLPTEPIVVAALEKARALLQEIEGP